MPECLFIFTYWVCTGTANLLSAAIECNTRYFIYVSTADVVIGEDPVYFGAENTTPVPKKHVMGGYARSKRDGEVLVTEANGRSLRNGKLNQQLNLRMILILALPMTHSQKAKSCAPSSCDHQ